MILVEFQSKIVIDDAGGDLSGGHGELHLVPALLQQSGIERQIAFLPEALVGVVADGVGGYWTDGANALAVYIDGQSAEDIGAGQ